MAVGFIRANQSHASASASTSAASFTFAVGQAGDAPKGILVLVFQGSTAMTVGTDIATSVTYGGTAVPAVTGGRAVDTAGEFGSCKAFFLGSSVPSGAPTGGVVVNRTNNTVAMWAVGFLVSATNDTEIPATVVLLQEDGAYAEQSVDDGSVSGTSSMRFAGSYYGGSTPAPAGTNSTVPTGASATACTNDMGLYGWNTVRETTAGTGSRLVGFTQVTSDDRAGVHLAIRETAVKPSAGLPTATGTAQPATVPQTSPALELSSFGSFSTVHAADTITDVTVAVNQFGSSALLGAPTYELWDGTSSRIGSVQTGSGSTSSSNVDTAVFTGVTYSQLGTLRVRIYGHSGTAASGATLSVDSASLTVRYMPGVGTTATAGLATATATAQPATVSVAYALIQPAIVTGEQRRQAPVRARLGPAGLSSAGITPKAAATGNITASAGLATATGTAQQTSQHPAGLATATGTALQTAQHPAGLATATGTAQPATVTVTATAGLATVTATAQQTSQHLIGLATATGTAQAPSSALTATAGLATATGVADQTAQQPIGLATAAAAALNATVSTSGNTVATAGLATATGTAQPATVTTAIVAPATPATAAGTAQPGTVTVTVTGTGLATATGTAQAPSPATTATAGLATAAGTALNATANTSGSTTAAAGLAAATGTAQPATVTVTANAGLATATGTALNATANTSGSTTATAGLATATGTAQPATVTTAITASAGLATATGTAQAPAVTITATAGLATATGTARQPSVSTSGSTTATAGLAAATGAALNATVTTAIIVTAGLATATGSAAGLGRGIGAGLATATATVQAASLAVLARAAAAQALAAALDGHVPVQTSYGTARIGPALAAAGTAGGTAPNAHPGGSGL